MNESEDYRELVQFTVYVGNSRDKVVEKGNNGFMLYDRNSVMAIWLNSGKRGDFPMGVKLCTAEDMRDLVSSGHTIKRARRIFDRNGSGTNVLVIRTKHSLNFPGPTEVEIKEKIETLDPGSVFAVHDSIPSPGMWLIFIQLRERCMRKRDYERVYVEWVTKIEEALRRNIKTDEMLISNPYIQLDGIPQNEYKLSIPKDTLFFCHQIVKDTKLDELKKYKTYEDWRCRNFKTPILVEYKI
jgi:hypothetical protein